MPLTPRLTGDPLTDYHILKMHTGYDHHYQPSQPLYNIPDGFLIDEDDE